MSWQDEYDQVEDRLAKFWKDNPEGRIETEIISITDDHKSAVHKASVFLNKKDVLDIHPSYIKGLKFFYVNKMEEVLDIALLKS